MTPYVAENDPCRSTAPLPSAVDQPRAKCEAVMYLLGLKAYSLQLGLALPVIYIRDWEYDM